MGAVVVGGARCKRKRTYTGGVQVRLESGDLP